MIDLAKHAKHGYLCRIYAHGLVVKSFLRVTKPASYDKLYARTRYKRQYSEYFFIRLIFLLELLAGPMAGHTHDYFRLHK